MHWINFEKVTDDRERGKMHELKYFTAGLCKRATQKAWNQCSKKKRESYKKSAAKLTLNLKYHKQDTTKPLVPPTTSTHPPQHELTHTPTHADVHQHFLGSGTSKYCESKHKSGEGKWTFGLKDGKERRKTGGGRDGEDGGVRLSDVPAGTFCRGGCCQCSVAAMSPWSPAAQH